MKNDITSIPPCDNPKVPPCETNFRHIIDVQTRFGDIDMFGHVNNGAYLAMLDIAKIAYFKQVMRKSVSPLEIGVVVVNINCSFYSPAYLDEPLAVASAVTRLSDKSLTLTQRLFNLSTGDVKCIASTILAGFDPRTATSTTIPAETSDLINHFENPDL